MNIARLRVVKVAETRFVLDGSEGAPWEVWQTDTENDAQKLVEFSGRLCYDASTEILTENGWKRFDQLVPGEKVATLHPVHHIVEYQEAVDYVQYPWAGPMYSIRTKFLDILVTPDHRLYCAKVGSNIFRFLPARDVNRMHVDHIQSADGWLGEEIEEFILPEATFSQRNRNRHTRGERQGSVRTTVRPALRLKMDHLLEFLGYFIAEGHIRRDGLGHHLVAITQRRERADRIAQSFRRLGYAPQMHPDPRKPQVVRLEVANFQLAELLSPLGKAAEKFVPREFLNLSRRQLRILFDALMAGDGHHDGSCYWTSSPRLADDVSEIAFKLGYTATIQEHFYPNRTKMYRVGLSRRRRTESPGRHTPDELIPYSGMVFCVTVPNGIVYVRRNGKPVFCGNCYQSWQKPNPATRDNRDYVHHIIESQHFSVLEHAGFTVAITGISRSCSHELVRHRHLSYSQISQRFFDETDAAMVVPSLYRDDPDAQRVLEEVHQATLDAYKRLVEIGTRRLATMRDKNHRRKRVREAARAALPNMTEVHIVVSGNHRAWREFFEKRGHTHAEPEIRELAVMIFKEVAQPMAPAVYQDMAIEPVTLDTGEVWETIHRRQPEREHAES